MTVRTFGAVLLTCMLVACFGQVPSELVYSVGDELSYNLHSLVDSRGHVLSENYRTEGSFATMDSTVVIKCTDKDDKSFLFAMNMWNTQVNVGQGSDGNSTLGDWLGDDVYFQQRKTGEITKVWYMSDDSPYFVNVKLGAVNGFQTHLVNMGQTEVFLEDDPVGQHYSNFTGTSGENVALMVVKTFDQNDFQDFPDTNLKPDNVIISASTYTGIHSDGYILLSTVNQLVDVVNIAQGNNSRNKRSEDPSEDSNSTAVNMVMSSQGALTLNFQSQQTPANATWKTGFKMADLQGGHLHEIIETTMSKYASRYIAKMAATKLPNIDAAQTLQTIVRSQTPKEYIPLARKMMKLFNIKPSELALIENYLEQSDDVSSLGKIFFILSGVNHPKASELLIGRYGLGAQDKQIRLTAIRATYSIAMPSEQVLDALFNIAFHHGEHQEQSQKQVRKSALFAFGTALGKIATSTQSSKKQLAIEGGKLLADKLQKFIKNGRERRIISLLHAIGNAGPLVVPLESIPFEELLQHQNFKVRMAFAGMLRKYGEEELALQLLQQLVLSDGSMNVQRKAGQVLVDNMQIPSEKLGALLADGSNFPFNRSWEGEFRLGGKEINLHADGQLFAGSNFDCNQTYFNFEAFAKATGTFTFWEWHKNAFEAEIGYGQIDGAQVLNEIYLKVWDDVLYDEPIADIDCSEHTYPIANIQQGFDVSYTLWVSVIPITFTASADFSFDLSWGWKICLYDLSALVELIPAPTFVFYGDAEIDLLIIKAGIELQGDFNTQIRPQGWIEGSECEVGFDVRRTSDPMSVDLTSYYAWKDCTLWIFDCHWGQHHTHTWFGWSMPAVNKILFQETWKIQP